MTNVCRPPKVAIIGAGFVGSTAAYALMLDGIVSDIVLIDANKEKAEGEALDLRHGLQFVETSSITFGTDFRLCKDADIVIVCAGAHQKKGETRLDLIQKNTAILKDIIPKIAKENRDCILLIVSNPVDVLTYAALKYSKFPKERVIGSGTVLDTARFRHLIAEKAHVSPKNVHAFILGEHGDSEFPAWSSANIATQPMDNFKGFTTKEKNILFEQTRKAAYEIISRKGATYYAIGLVIAQLVRAIMGDGNAVYPVSTLMDGKYGLKGVCLSVPCVLGRSGVIRQLEIPLSAKEKSALKKSAAVLKGYLKKV
jgi:L-lactate dehydrogenase